MTLPTMLGRSVTNPAALATSIILNPSSSPVGTAIATGNWMVAFVAMSSTTTSITPPAGWTQIMAPVLTGTEYSGAWARIRQSGDTSYTWALNAAGTTGGGVIAWGDGADPTISNWIIGPTTTRAVSAAGQASGSRTINWAETITTTVADTLVLTLSTERTTVATGGVPAYSGATSWFQMAESGSQIQTIDYGYINKTTAGATGRVVLTYGAPQDSNGIALQLGIAPAVSAPAFSDNAVMSGAGSLSATNSPAITTTASMSGNGSLSASASTGVTATASMSATGTLTVSTSGAAIGTATMSGTGTLTATASAPNIIRAIPLSGTGTLTATASAMTASTNAAMSGTGTLSGSVLTPVDIWISQRPMYVAWRAQGDDNPEEVLFSYQQAAAWNATQALEISVQQTSDGVWVNSHDQTTGRVFAGTSLDIPSNTWATLSTKVTIRGGYPITKLVDILDAFPGRIFWVDNKNTVNISNFLDTLDAHGGPGQIVVKGFSGSTGYASLALARGYRTWGYFYAADISSLPTRAPYWTLFGGDVTGSTADWTALKSYGKPVLAHTIHSLADKNTATALGADGYMAGTARDGTVPQSPVYAAMTGAGSLSAVGSISANAQMSGTGSLSAGTKPAFTATAAMSGTGTLIASSSLNPVATANMSGAGSLSTATSIQIATSASLSGTGTLSATASTPRVTVTVSLSGTGTLSGFASQNASGLAAMSGTGALTLFVPPKDGGGFTIAGAQWMGILETRRAYIPVGAGSAWV